MINWEDMKKKVAVIYENTLFSHNIYFYVKF